ncbi:hypothetical protein EC9_54390 [Rosistilla ulvae]|uniref:Uncharacterized protein n=1 Tax=Rosistilla ulvae TaxID=1930277 RepID=A0A517M8K7_9BACT|nr:hypothetical protein EC9_54390 [Rosistilla ulvae]
MQLFAAPEWGRTTFAKEAFATEVTEPTEINQRPLQHSVASELSVAKTSICDPSGTIAPRGPRVPEVRRCATTPGYLLASLREHRVQHTCRTMNTNENGVAIEFTDTEPAIH